MKFADLSIIDAKRHFLEWINENEDLVSTAQVLREFQLKRAKLDYLVRTKKLTTYKKANSQCNFFSRKELNDFFKS